MENERKQMQNARKWLKKQTYYVCYGIDSFVSYALFTRNWLQGMHIEYSTALRAHTHLFTCIIASTTSYASF